MSPTCGAPLTFDTAIDYWAGELPADAEAAVEAHTFACDGCARELAAAGALAGGIAGAVRAGRLHGVVTDAILNRLAADGARIRMFTLDGPAIVPCAVWAGDDLVVSRIRADFTGVTSVTIATRQGSGDEIARLVDVREILHAFSAAHLRALPATRVVVTVTAQAGDVERTLAEYSLEHAGSFARPDR
jgi:hypothetical protein